MALKTISNTIIEDISSAWEQYSNDSSFGDLVEFLNEVKNSFTKKKIMIFFVLLFFGQI